MDTVKPEQFCFTEICSQVEAASVFLRLNSMPLHVLIQTNKILTQTADGQSRIYNLQMELDPSSCSSISHKVNQGISLRFQTQPKKDPICNESVKSSRDSKENRKRQNRFHCSCRCKICGINLLSEPNQTYTRVLPLPSSGDDDLSDSWACCDHSALGDPCNKSSCSAKEIYQDEFHFAFPDKAVCRSNLRMVSDKNKLGIIQCGRCYSTLGEITSLPSLHDKYYLFDRNSATVEIIEKYLPWSLVHSSLKLEDMICSDIIHNVRTKEIYKFLICDKRKTPYILMQVLNMNGCIGYQGFEKLQSSSSEKLSALKSMIAMQGAGIYEQLESFPQNVGTGKRIREHLSGDNPQNRVVKLLYTLATTGFGQKMSETWVVNPNVKVITLPDRACMELFLLLTESTLIMPSRHMTPTGLLCGFLSIVE